MKMLLQIFTTKCYDKLLKIPLIIDLLIGKVYK